MSWVRKITVKKNYYTIKNRKKYSQNLKQYSLNSSKSINALLTNNSYNYSFFVDALGPIDIFNDFINTNIKNNLGDILKNSFISLLHGACKDHHALAGYLALYFFQFKNIEEDIFLKTTSFSKRATSKELDTLILSLSKCERATSILKACRALGGASSSIEILNSSKESDEIVFQKNNRCEISIPLEFWRYTDQEKLEFINLEILSIDGVILTIGEINYFLQKSYKNKTPLLILCRGFSEEVLATILENFKRKNLNVFLCQFPTDHTANLLWDISELAGCNVVSTITGDIISSKKKENLGILNYCRIEKNQILFNCSKKNIKYVKNKIKLSLEEFRKSKDFCQDMEKVFISRLKMLDSERIQIFLSRYREGTTALTKSRLQTFLRIINEVKQHGIIDLYKVKKSHKHIVIFDSLLENGIRYLPSFSFYYGLKSAISMKKSLESVETAMVID